MTFYHSHSQNPKAWVRTLLDICPGREKCTRKQSPGTQISDSFSLCRKLPTFLYVMPFSKTRIFLEETSLVARPAIQFDTLKERLKVRMAHLGIKVSIKPKSTGPLNPLCRPPLDPSAGVCLVKRKVKSWIPPWSNYSPCLKGRATKGTGGNFGRQKKVEMRSV
jgi:hypothetical protein